MSGCDDLAEPAEDPRLQSQQKRSDAKENPEKVLGKRDVARCNTSVTHLEQHWSKWDVPVLETASSQTNSQLSLVNLTGAGPATAGQEVRHLF